ncbi:MAG: adenylate/guanylate cyclase domain-containing protein [Pseudomonadota bacterium]
MKPEPVNRPYFLSRAALIRTSIALVAVLLTAWAQWLTPPGAAYLADEWLRDRFIQLQARDNAKESRILVIDIDEASMAAYGPWPWPRARIADLVERLLTTYRARGVALDIVMPEAGNGDGDVRLGLLTRNGPLVLAQAFDYNTMSPLRLHDGLLAGASADYRGGGVPATGYIGNHAALAQGAKAGNIGFIPDADGVLRRLPLLTSYEGRLYPTLTLALLNCCGGGPALSLPPGQFMRVSYRRDWTAYDVVPAARILDLGEVRSDVEDRLVLIGSSSLGLGDRVTTPLASQRPGLGSHAAMLSTLLDYQAGLAPAPWPGRLIAFLFAFATALVTSYALPRMSALASVGVLAASSLAWLALAYLITQHDPGFASTGPLASNLFLLAVAVPFQWQLTQQRSRNLLGTLRQYVAREVVDELLRSDLKDPLKPTQRDVTTLIADMEGYTTHVESLPVQEAADLTRDFLDCLTGPVLAHQGTLDKYTGDGLVAFWGAPLPIADHADLALDAAQEIVRRVHQMSAERIAAGKLPLRVRIGIDSGQAMAGDFGTSFRSIYTAVGDSVNTASRLEQAARDFPHDVIVGAGTVERARRHRFQLLGERLLRGKERPTTLFTFEESQAPALRSMPITSHATVGSVQ